MSNNPGIRDDQLLDLNLEHNFWSWSAQGAVDPIPVVRAEGVFSGTRTASATWISTPC